MSKRNALSADRVRELLRYEPETGKLYWRVDKARAKAGEEAGTVFSSDHCFYRKVGIDRRAYRSHRLIWLIVHGRWPAEEIDHIDGDGLNNRLDNLREVTRQENAKNLRRPRNNTSGHPGVYWSAPHDLWVSRIKVGGTVKSLGYFRNKGEAIAARLRAEVKYRFHPNHGRAA